jgi:hypothetical protein
MDAAKDARQQLAISWIMLQLDKVAVELIQSFVTLDQKVVDDIIHWRACDRGAKKSGRRAELEVYPLIFGAVTTLLNRESLSFV